MKRIWLRNIYQKDLLLLARDNGVEAIVASMVPTSYYFTPYLQIVELMELAAKLELQFGIDFGVEPVEISRELLSRLLKVKGEFFVITESLELTFECQKLGIPYYLERMAEFPPTHECFKGVINSLIDMTQTNSTFLHITDWDSSFIRTPGDIRCMTLGDDEHLGYRIPNIPKIIEQLKSLKEK